MIDLAKNNPVLEEKTKQLDKSIEKLGKSIYTAKESSDKVGGSSIGDPLRELGDKIEKKYGGKYK